MIAFAAGCRERYTPTEPRPLPTSTPTPNPTRTPSPTPTPRPAPITITGVLDGGPLYSYGNGIVVEVCGCTTESMEILLNDLPPEPLPCATERYIPHASPIRITIRSSAWSVTQEFTVPLDPHVGLRARASCR